MKGAECRLCLCRSDLLWLFDETLKNDNLQKIVQITCGIQMSKDDAITQMICRTCCQIILRMFKFRTKAIKNDNDLRAKHTQTYILNLKSTSNTHHVTSGVIKHQQILPKYKNAHPSVKAIIRKYPTTKLPEMELKVHYDPYITLLSHEVDEYFKDHNYSPREIEEMKIAALSERLKFPPPNKTYKRIADVETDTSCDVSAVKKIRLNGEITLRSILGLETTPQIKEHSKSFKLEAHDTAVKESKEKSCEEREKLPPIKLLLVRKKHEEQKQQSRCTLQRKTARPITYNEDLSFLTSTCTDRALETNSSRNQGETSRDSLPILGKDMSKGSHGACEKKNEDGKLTPEITTTIEKKDDNDRLHKIKASILFKLITETPSLNQPNHHQNNVRVATPTQERNTPFCFKFNAEGPSFDKPGHNQNNIRIATPTISQKEDTGMDKNGSEKSLDTYSNVSENSNSSFEYNFVAPIENSPELSQLNKTTTLFTCKVCSNPFSTVRDLKQHVRRTHTKCPFCSKRFRSLAGRNEHVKTSCDKHAPSPMPSLKKVCLKLVRVDTVQELRDKYPSAFRNCDENDDQIESDGDMDSLFIADSPTRDDEPVAESNKEVEIAFASDNISNTTSSDNPNPNNTSDNPQNDNVNDKSEVTTSKSQEQRSRDDDVICISDDESDASRSKTRGQIIKVVNPNMMNLLNEHDDDIHAFKDVLVDAARNRRTIHAKLEMENLKDNTIIDGSSPKSKIFKNLRKHMYKYKVPVEIDYSKDLVADYKEAKHPPNNKTRDFWFQMTPIDIRNPESFPRFHPPNNYFCTNESVQDNRTRVICSAPKQQNIIVNGLDNFPNQVVPVSPKNKNIAPVTGIAANEHQSKPVVLNGSISSKYIRTTMSGIETNLVPQSASSTYAIVPTNFTGVPLVLNSSQSVTNNTTHNTFTNVIVVPHTFVTTNENVITMATTQPPLPVIQSVTGSAVESLTVPVPTTQPQQTPAIRVKPISELF